MPSPTSFRRTALRYGKPALTILTIAVAAWFIRREVAELKPSQVMAAIRATPARALVLSAILTAISYGCLSIAECCAFRYIGRALTPGEIIPRSLSVHALASNLGFGLLTGAAVRYRLYAGKDVDDEEVNSLSVRISTAIFASGFVTLGLTLIFEAVVFPRQHVLPALGLGAVLLCPAILWFLDIGRTRQNRPATAARWLALTVSIGDWFSSGAALFVLSSPPASALPAFMAVFLASSLLGSLAGVPAAIGVLDAAMLGSSVLGRQVHESAAALLIYRLVYFVAPLALAGTGLLVRAILGRRARMWEKARHDQA